MRQCRPPAFPIVFLVQEALTTAATLLSRESSESSSTVELQARGTNVVKDKYFIPAIATIGAFVLLSLVCLYFLGCCCNSRKVDEFDSKTTTNLPARSTIRNSTAYQPPAVNSNAIDGSDKYSNVSPNKTPHATPPAPPSTRLDAQQQWSNGNQWPSMIPPTSHGFQSTSHTAIPPSVMSVHHLNSTAASYQHRDYQVPRPHIQPEGRRMSTMSSGTSSTQIGSGVAEQVPYGYSPHQGNTLSYASSTAPSMVAPVWDGSAIPTNENPATAPGNQGQYQQTPAYSGPPAYIDDGKGHPVDMRKY